MGIADAGTAMTLHSAAPAAIVIARTFMGRLLVLPPDAPLADKSRPGFHAGCGL
jgi:hypothetical protein